MDEPAKRNDHAMDALRYAVVEVDGLFSVPVTMDAGTADEDARDDDWLSLDNDEVWE